MTADQPASFVTRDVFLKNLNDSGLSGVADSGTADLTQFAAQSPDGPALASALVNAGKLTQYQANAILAGRLADLRIGNYDVLDRLGAGAMGTVYKARHRRMKRVVALKTLTRTGADHSKKFVARFQREVEMIAKLIHPNIVMAFDADEAECGPFLVMEFVDGRDLASIVASEGPLSFTQAVGSVIQAAKGLEYAHTHGLIHRDIKPANILRTVNGQIKVADLGLARLNDEANPEAASLTQAGGVVGTIDYMAPEQAVDSTSIDHRADQYSLGCTLFFLLTGQPVYLGSSAMAVLLKHRDAPLPSLSEARPGSPAELEKIFQKMVAKTPQDRYPSMTEVIQALESVTLPAESTQPAVSPKSVAASRFGDPVSISSSSSQSSHFDATKSYSAAGAEARMSVSVAGVAVLLAEASRTQSGIMRKFLEQLGITDVRVALSGAEALQQARAARTQVLISSMHLKDMTGVQLARAIRTDPTLAEVGFVLATSESDKEMVADVQGVARTYITPKPFELTRLARTIAEAAGLTSAK